MKLPSKESSGFQLKNWRALTFMIMK